MPCQYNQTLIISTLDRVSQLSSHQFFGHAGGALQAGAAHLRWMRPSVPPEEMELHTHADAHFVLVLGGRYRSLAYRDGAPSHGPALVFNPAGTEHRDCFADLDGAFMTVSFSAADARRLGDGRAIGHPVRLARLDQALALFRVAWSGAGTDAPAALHAQALALALLDQASQPAAPGRLRAPPSWLRTAQEMIEDRCTEPLQLERIAATAGVHPVHLTRSFRACLGQTPGQWQRRCRLERAMAALLRGRGPLAEIALAAGYADQSHLTRAVQQVYGMAPARLARLLRERGQVCSVQDPAAGVAP